MSKLDHSELPDPNINQQPTSDRTPLNGLPPNPYNALAWIVGEPDIGDDVWIGAFTLIDGSGGLKVGRGVNVSSGAQLLTHSSARRTVTARAHPHVDRAPTVIEDYVFIGANAVDYSGYPDCRPEYIQAYTEMANLATKAGVEGHHLQIHTPLIGLTKAEIIKTGIGLDVDYALTHSCYNPDNHDRHCGQCDACLLRRRGFEQAKVADPTLYAI